MRLAFSAEQIDFGSTWMRQKRTARWVGTMTIREWTDDLVELALTEGARWGATFETFDDCEPIADGVLRIEGVRFYPDDKRANLPPQFEDVETGALLCAASDAAS